MSFLIRTMSPPDDLGMDDDSASMYCDVASVGFMSTCITFPATLRIQCPWLHRLPISIGPWIPEVALLPIRQLLRPWLISLVP